MGRGRPPNPGTAEEKAAARRERVRNNVRALRERRKQGALAGSGADIKDISRLEWIQETQTRFPVAQKAKDANQGNQVDRKGSVQSATTEHESHQTSLIHLVKPQVEAPSMIPVNIDNRKLYGLAMLATFREMFLPDAVYLPPDATSPTARPWDSKQFLWTPCAFWITSAWAKASNQDNSVLKTSLLSIGMLLKGVENQDQSLKVASLEMYRRSLHGIRKTLEPMTQRSSEKPKDVVALYLACHAAAMFELVQNADLRATMRHLRGVSQLICHLGDGSDEEGKSMAWLLLQDYRFAEMGLCMKYRYASYSSIARRRFEKSSIDRKSPVDYPAPARGRGSQNMFVALTDIADDISAVMVQLDSSKPGSSKPIMSTELRHSLENLDQIWQRFPHLHSQLVERYGTEFLFEDADEGDGSSEHSYKFLTYDIGAAWCYNLMTQLYCLETSIEVTTLLLKIEHDRLSDTSTSTHEESPASERTQADSIEEIASLDRLHEFRRLHRAICIQLTQCLLYFLQTDKGITGQALAIYPLDAALNMLTVEMERLKVDFSQAQMAKREKEFVGMVLEDMVSINNAKMFVERMQARAKEFGLPSFSEAAPQQITSDRTEVIARPD